MAEWMNLRRDMKEFIGVGSGSWFQYHAVTALAYFLELRQFQLQEKRSPPSPAGITGSRRPEHPRCQNTELGVGEPGLGPSSGPAAWASSGNMTEMQSCGS